MEQKIYIVRNRMKTPDGTILESRDKHDDIAYVDNITKRDYFLDGGLSYIRSSTNGDEVMMTITSEDPFSVIRQHLHRGTYTNGLSYDRIPLKSMSTEHIKATIVYVTSHPGATSQDWTDWYVGLLNQELGWRAAIESKTEKTENV